MAYALAFSPSGHHLAVGGNTNAAQVWDLGRPSDPVAPPHRGNVSALAFLDTRTLATASTSEVTRSGGVVRFWNIRTAQESSKPIVDPNGGVSPIAVSHDGSMLATVTYWNDLQGRIRIWSLKTRRLIRELRGGIGSYFEVAFAPNGKRLAAAGSEGVVRLWNLTDQRSTPEEFTAHEGAVHGLAFSPDGSRLITGDSSGVAIMWAVDAASSIRTRVIGDGPHFGLAVSRSGTQVASGTESGEILLWSLADQVGKPRVVRGHGDMVSALAFTPDGSTLFSGSADGTIAIWNTTNGERIGEKVSVSDGPVTDLVISPDARMLVTAGGRGTSTIWSVTKTGNSWTLQPRETFSHEGGTISALALSASGTELFSASTDNSLQQRLLGSNQQPASVQAPGALMDLAVSPTRPLLAGASFDGAVYLWNTADMSDRPTSSPARGRGRSASRSHPTAGRWRLAPRSGP